jgi:sporulation protein YlmC with PRC-barrel domain
MRHATTETTGSGIVSQARHAAPTLLSASTVIGDNVCNLKDEDLGSIDDIMLDTSSGKIRYAVLSSGGFLGMGDRLFAVPWSALKLDAEHKRFILDVDVDRLKEAPGFDKDHWPDMADSKWSSSNDSYYSAGTDTPRR